MAFGETLVPGYPFWLAHTGGAEFDSKVQKEIHAHYLDQAVDLDAGHLDALCDRAKEHGIHVMLGCFERPAGQGWAHRLLLAGLHRLRRVDSERSPEDHADV